MPSALTKSNTPKGTSTSPWSTKSIGVTRLLWVGKERTIESFQGFFAAMGQEVISKICFVCSDMWEPYLKLIRERCSEALHILDRFHIVSNMKQGARQGPRRGNGPHET